MVPRPANTQRYGGSRYSMQLEGPVAESPGPSNLDVLVNFRWL